MKNNAVDYYDHPVFHSSQLLLETPAMRNLKNHVLRLVWTGATGALLTGQARQGKSTAARQLIGTLGTRDKKVIPTYYVSIPRRDQKNIKTIYRELCWSANLIIKPNSPSDVLCDQFVHYLADQAVESECNKALLIVDEMQRLAINQLDAFAEVYDKLLIFGIELTALFIGNDPECWELIELIEEKQFRHIHGRFFTQGISFKGLSSRKDVESCLDQYDQLKFPRNGPTYTEYFLPKAVQSGWKFSSLSSDIWNVFTEYRRNYSIKTWGMKYFTITANTLLCDFLPNTDLNAIDDEVIHECIRISGLVPSLVRTLQ